MSKLIKLIVIWLLFSSACLADEQPKEAVKKILSQPTVVDSSTGLIEGNKYIASIIQHDTDPLEIALAVFKIGNNSKPRLVSKSAWWPTHPRWFDLSVKINNNSIYFSLSGSGGCCSEYFLQHQFKPQSRKFTLIGTESSEMGFKLIGVKSGESFEDNYVSYKYGSSINYLSGEVVHWRIQRASSSKAPYKDDFLNTKTPKKRIDKLLKFSRHEKVLLDNFDIWSEMDFHPKNIRCYFDAYFKFICV